MSSTRLVMAQTAPVLGCWPRRTRLGPGGLATRCVVSQPPGRLRRCGRAGRTGHLDAAYAMVTYDAFAAARFGHYADLHLLHTHREPFGSPTPWLSIIVPTDRSLEQITPTLSASSGRCCPRYLRSHHRRPRRWHTEGQLKALSFSQPAQAFTHREYPWQRPQAGVDAARQVCSSSRMTCSHSPTSPNTSAHRDRPGSSLS